MLSGNLTLPHQSYKWTKWALLTKPNLRQKCSIFWNPWQISQTDLCCKHHLSELLLICVKIVTFWKPAKFWEITSAVWHPSVRVLTFWGCTKVWIQASAPPRTICRAVVTLHCHQISMLNTILSLIAYNTSIDICIVDFSPPKCLPYLIFGFFLGYNLRDQSYQKLPPRLIEFRRQRLSTDPDMFEDKNFWTF